MPGNNLILVADDDFIARELLRNALESANYEVLAARDGREALQLYEKERPRLVITDWEMPHLSGLDLCRELRAGGDVGYVYVIMLTSHAGSEQIVEGMSAGADDFIVKPFQPAELLVRIRAGQRILSLETRELLIFALAKLAESRDTDTGRHLERVQRYAHALAIELSMSPRFANEIDKEWIRLVYQTSPLHDIGKVGIPDSVLLKPGRLTEEEFEIMKSHTTIGADTLEAALRQCPTARFLQVARDIALSHHERYDGKGYPQQLAGDDIPLCARIVAVADVYDALTSKRVYKPAYSHEAARETIVNDSGRHFDPEVVAAFLAVESQFLQIQKALGEALPPAPPIAPTASLILPAMPVVSTPTPS